MLKLIALFLANVHALWLSSHSLAELYTTTCHRAVFLSLSLGAAARNVMHSHNDIIAGPRRHARGYSPVGKQVYVCSIALPYGTKVKEIGPYGSGMLID